MNKNLLTLKAALASAFFCLSIFSTALYTSCNKKDNCDGVVCNNGGSCTDGKCECLRGYSGLTCEVVDAKKFAGTFTGVNICNGSDTFRIDTAIGTKVFINMNIGAGACAKNIDLEGSAARDTVIFPAQGFVDQCQASYAFSANGFMRHDSLIMTIRYNFPSFKDTCTFSGRK